MSSFNRLQPVVCLKPRLLRAKRSSLNGLVFALVFSISFGNIAVFAGVFDGATAPIKMPKNQAPLPKEAGLDDLFQRTETNFAPLSEYSLRGIRIPGLNDDAVRALGSNHFVVAENTPFKKLPDVYRENRLNGKPNFVTADSIVHPYLAFTNGVAAHVVARIAPDLQFLLSAMYSLAALQFKGAEDATVRSDIEKNCGYYMVALKLLHPELQIADVGSASAIAAAELQNIEMGKIAKSAIFNREMDFSEIKPLGWYAGSKPFANFYRCRQWLACTTFTVSDPASNDPSVNDFGRSILIYQNLQQSKVASKSGLEVWKRLRSALELVGTVSSREHMLLPSDYEAVLGGGKLSLTNLSEPFYRTKLLLSVRKQRPLAVGSASIFNKTEQKDSLDTSISFRFFPPTTDVELNWLCDRGHHYKPQGSDNPDTPLALLDLDAHGAMQAGNLLLDSIYHLDPVLITAFPPLLKEIKASTAAGNYSLGQARWQLLSCYFRPLPDGAAAPLRTRLWLERQLESAFACWVDGHLSVAPLSENFRSDTTDGSNQSEETASRSATSSLPGTAAGPSSARTVNARSSAGFNSSPTVLHFSPVSGDAASENTAAKPAVTQPAPATTAAPTQGIQPAAFQYLEPRADLYRKIASDADEFSQQLTTLQLMPGEAKNQFAEFSKLALRLAGIADRELGYRPVSEADMKLLAEMDLVLDKVSLPVQGTINFNNGEAKGTGCNLGLGRVGHLHVLCHTTKGTMLCRGPVYTYYEMPGASIKPEHWERNLEYAMVRPPDWTYEFDIVQDPAAAKARRATTNQN